MGTRGLYGFRRNGFDKTTYNHFDSYPEYLGKLVGEFCANTSTDDMRTMYDRIQLVSEGAQPNAQQVDFCQRNGLVDLTVSNCSTDDWYCLLRSQQGDLEKLKELCLKHGQAYMIDSHTFIEDSLFCEYAYIIDLDTEQLEYYVGFQKQPQVGNRYGVSPDKNGYYPCKLAGSFPLERLYNGYDEAVFIGALNMLA